MYQYKAKIKKVIDGDTYDAVVDLGFKINLSVRIRLLGIDTPETYRPSCDEEYNHGIKAKNFVECLIGGKEVTIRTYKSEQGVYNRWEADIECPNGEDLCKALKKAGFEKKQQY